MDKLSQTTYIWIDGAKPSGKLRSKVRIIQFLEPPTKVNDFPEWGFDGSSTFQASGDSSDLILIPVCFVTDPLGNENDYLVMCEVYTGQGQPHSTNKRATAVKIYNNICERCDPWIGFEQEYTLFKGRDPLGWPRGGYPAPQGPFYCGVGSDEVFGRSIVEEHAQACIDAGIMIFGTNAEVMPGQWEFQIGYRNIPAESADPVTVSDHLWLARWLLYRIGEDFGESNIGGVGGVTATLDPKPVKGDWNGAGCHTNFSTKQSRDPKTGREAIAAAIKALESNHAKHIVVYGAGLAQRLTGLHETASITEFTAGEAHRGCSIRIPASVAEKGYGYIEDRRPGANIDPYEVSTALMETICVDE